MYDKLPAEFSQNAFIGVNDLVNVTPYKSGVADRVALTDQPRVRMIVEHPETGDYTTFRDFFRTHRGGTHPFLVVDWTDYSLTDEPMTGTVDGINQVFGLVRTYSTGNRSDVRKIQFAESTGGTLLAADGSTLLTYSAWSFVDGLDAPLSVSTSTLDQITFTTAPANGSGQPKATVGLFRVLMTFANDELLARVRTSGLASIAQIELIEEILRA